MRIAVTGATGFLGKYVVQRLLAQGDDVLALGRNLEAGRELRDLGAHFFPFDLCAPAGLTPLIEGCDAMVHCAALSAPWGPKELFYKVNVEGTRHVLDALSRAGIARLVHISTPSIYFDGTHRLGVKEDAVLPAVKVNCYAESKWQAERLVAHAAMQGLETLTLRPRALFGPGDTVLLPRLIQANARFGIPIMHSAAVLTDLSYVGNVADAVALALRAPKNCLGRVYNISNGEPVDLDAVLLQLFDALEIPLRRRRLPYALAHGLGCMSEGLASLTGREPTLSRYGVGVLSRSMTLDISRAQAYLDYTPQVSVQEGIARFASWWQEQRSA